VIRIGGPVLLDADHELAVGEVQVAPVEHEAVQRVAVDRVVDEVAVVVVQRHLPELGDRWQVVEVERHRVAVLAAQRVTVGVDVAERPGV
jgi:hypothetical protein